MGLNCTHTESIRSIIPSAIGCEKCLRLGQAWFHLRVCRQCGDVMAGAVAPLTAAVLGAVDDHYTGLASGLNSAVARTGGLIATALAAAVFAAHGPALLAAFNVAAWTTAATALADGAAVWLLGADLKPAEPDRGVRRAG